MPVYGYRCPMCHTTLDVTHSMHEQPKPCCETCNTALVRSFGVPAVVFKGSGFYRTDSRSGASTHS